ncbi:MAG: hypothetical protein FJ098_12780, partial [Deltaproteobacteria bacterium]|nr:hypothetical protein [Deltaproteobacteria bacterium]
ASFLVQALAAGPLLARLGTTFVNLGYAWATLVSALGLILAPGVVTVTAGRIAGRELKDVFKTPVTLIHYATFPDAFRGRVRSVIFGLSIPLATLASGLLLVGLEQAGGLAGRRLDLLVLAAGLLFVLASAAQNRGYRLSLVELLLERVGPGGPSAPGGEVSDGRILQVRAARRSPLYLVRRRWIAARFSLDLGDPEADPGEPARRRAVEDLMILVELYRPRGEGDLRGLLLAALEDPRREVQDTAYMVVRGILPHRYARLARRLFRSPRPGGTP